MSRIRERCRREGTHKFKMYPELMSSPVVFCSRWFCDGSAVSIYCDPRLAETIHNTIPRSVRFPPCEIKDGETIESWEM